MGFIPPDVRPPTALQERRELQHTLKFLADGDLFKKAKWLLVIGLIVAAPLVLRLMTNNNAGLATWFFAVSGIAAAVCLLGALICLAISRR